MLHSEQLQFPVVFFCFFFYKPLHHCLMYKVDRLEADLLPIFLFIPGKMWMLNVPRFI